MKYDIVTAPSREDLVNEINRTIHLGWKPHGGVSVSVVEYEFMNEREGYKETYRGEVWAQAMVSTIARDE